MNYKKLSILISVFILLAGLFYLFSCSQSPESCRKELEKQGIEYFPPNFVICAGEGDSDMVDLFLCGGMNPNVRVQTDWCYSDICYDFYTPLLAAATNGHTIKGC
jgi:hypothetical protein